MRAKRYQYPERIAAIGGGTIVDLIHDRRAYYERLASSKDGEKFKIVVEEYDCLLRVCSEPGGVLSKFSEFLESRIAQLSLLNETQGTAELNGGLNEARFIKQELDAIKSAPCSSHRSGVIYLVGSWVSTGPRANDCYFEVGYVTTDLTMANQKAREFTDAAIMEASDGSSFCDWDQRSVAFT